MGNMKQINSVAIAALFASVSAHPADDSIVMAQEGGKQTASFNIAASKCVLKDDQVRCVSPQSVAAAKNDAQTDRPTKTPIASPRVREQTPFNGEQISTALEPPLYAEADGSH